MGMSLSRSSVQLMLKSQKMIQDEFGVRINLSDKQAIGKFLAYASKSSSKDLVNIVTRLQDELTPVNTDLPKAKPEKKAEDKTNVRYYRGQRVLVEPKQAKAEDDSAESKPTKTIIYRGQKIAV